MVIFFGTETSPSSGPSSPTIMRKSVVLPAPFGPTRPTFSPGLSWNEASTKRTCLPYCLLTRAKEIIGAGKVNRIRGPSPSRGRGGRAGLDATIGKHMASFRRRRGLVVVAAIALLGGGLAVLLVRSGVE